MHSLFPVISVLHRLPYFGLQIPNRAALPFQDSMLPNPRFANVLLTQATPSFCRQMNHNSTHSNQFQSISNSDSYSSPTERNASPTITMVFHVIFHLTTTDQTTGEHCVPTLAALPICPRCPLLNCQIFHSTTGPIILSFHLLYNAKNHSDTPV